YVMQRFMRAAIGTHNIDNCSRVCHSPTSWALRRSFGLSGATGSFDDIEAAEVALLIGVNPTQGHPVVGARIKQAALEGLQLITADPRRIELADYGALHLANRPGTNAALVNGLTHVLIRDGLADEAFIAERTEGYDAVAQVVDSYTPASVQEITGVPAGDVERAAHLYGEADRACILWGLGVTEHLYGSEVVQLLCNMALLTGQVGRPGAALLPLRGQNNVQGSSDMGALPDTFTDYRSVTDDEVTSSFEQRWGVEMKRERGMKIPEMFDAAVEGRLKAMYIFGADVAQTDPDTTHVEAALSSLDFLVCQDIFENETTRYADVILPASSFLEKEGTFTNAERRLQLVSPAAPPPGAAKTDFEILTTMSSALGHDMGYETPSDVMDEIAAMTPRYAGLSHERIGRDGLQWPVAADGTDTPILYSERFELLGGKARFAALPYKPPGEEADAEYPLILVTGRRLERYNAGTMTRRTANLDLMPEDWLEIHPADAAELEVEDRSRVALRSRRGEIELPVRVTERIEPGHVFTAFHFPETRTNLLVGSSSDVNTSCPEYKVVAVAVEPVGAARPVAPAGEPALLPLG
ncbi:MAG: molybdopterin oxidoreductase family protein, partial [Solirubrobacterales bacterium]